MICNKLENATKQHKFGSPAIQIVSHLCCRAGVFSFFNCNDNNALRRFGCTPPGTWSTLTSDFSAPNHRKDMKLLFMSPRLVKMKGLFFFKLISLLKKWRTNIKRHFGSFAPDKTGAKKSQKFNKKISC